MRLDCGPASSTSSSRRRSMRRRNRLRSKCVASFCFSRATEMKRASIWRGARPRSPENSFWSCPRFARCSTPTFAPPSRGSGSKSLDEIVFCYPGVAAVIRHRIAHRLYGLGATMLARIIARSRIPDRNRHPPRRGDRRKLFHRSRNRRRHRRDGGHRPARAALSGCHPGREALRGRRELAPSSKARATSDHRGRSGDLRRRDGSRQNHHRQGLVDRRQRLADAKRAAGKQHHAGEGAQRKSFDNGEGI